MIVVHNRYQQRGGEDDVFAAEVALLSDHGHHVRTYVADNQQIASIRRAALARATFWNDASYRAVRSMCRTANAGVVHFHNTFPLVSPAGYYAARDAGSAVVQTLHNYRLICPNAMLFRNGRPCEDCVGRRFAWPAVLHACYRGDRVATAVTASMVGWHRAVGSWHNAVNLYIALTSFAKRKFVDGGIPPAQIVVKPNFLSDDPGEGDHRGGFALFVGRLSPEKGIDTLLSAWAQLGGRVPLKIAGSGPLGETRTPGVEWLGWQSTDRVLALMQNASLLVLPSSWYEGFPVTLVQAFATGLPVIVSGHGSLAEIVDDGCTGYHFEPGNAEDLAAKVDSALSHPSELAKIGRNARREFERQYTAERNYQQLLEVYRYAIERQACSRG